MWQFFYNKLLKITNPASQVSETSNLLEVVIPLSILLNCVNSTTSTRKLLQGLELEQAKVFLWEERTSPKMAILKENILLLKIYFRDSSPFFTLILPLVILCYVPNQSSPWLCSKFKGRNLSWTFWSFLKPFRNKWNRLGNTLKRK